ncbi:MAG: 6-phosphogluconolactonase [Chloroflexota bacterium]|nr:6-phosphogluconolactonase [Chloroflexota bacterium]MDQ5864906.1 6-phosphogluconolactonase [Chloroflexota bacterium]
MSRPHVTVRIEDDANGVAAHAANIFTQLAEEAAAQGRTFRVALSGGSTPRLLYQLLTSEEYRERVAWEGMEFFFGDERWVPRTDKDSNYKLANDYLFEPLGIDEGRVFPMPTEGVEPQEAAERYEADIRRAFSLASREMPRFDLIFLGMGDDGHTASLFPHSPALHEYGKLVAANYVEKLDTWRTTLTYPVLNAAENVLFMVAGESKAPALKQVLEGEYDPKEYPSQLLREASGHVTWLVDRAAAAQLESGAD